MSLSRMERAARNALACRQSRTNRRWVDVKQDVEGSSRSMAVWMGVIAVAGFKRSVENRA